MLNTNLMELFLHYWLVGRSALLSSVEGGRLLRVMAYMLKFIAVLKARGSDAVGLSVKDVSAAEEFWIKSSQGVLLQEAKFQM